MISGFKIFAFADVHNALLWIPPILAIRHVADDGVQYFGNVCGSHYLARIHGMANQARLCQWHGFSVTDGALSRKC